MGCGCLRLAASSQVERLGVTSQLVLAEVAGGCGGNHQRDETERSKAQKALHVSNSSTIVPPSRGRHGGAVSPPLRIAPGVSSGRCCSIGAILPVSLGRGSIRSAQKLQADLSCYGSSLLGSKWSRVLREPAGVKPSRLTQRAVSSGTDAALRRAHLAANSHGRNAFGT